MIGEVQEHGDIVSAALSRADKAFAAMVVVSNLALAGWLIARADLATIQGNAAPKGEGATAETRGAVDVRPDLHVAPALADAARGD